jgi:DNA repair protein RecO (recombination protein O)
MIEQTTGIALRIYPLTETSLIVHWLTAEHGRIATAAKGARRVKSPFRGKLDLFYEGTLSIQRNRRSDLHALREFDLTQTHEALRHELAYLQQAAYCAALIEQASETETPVPELFELLKQLLAYLPKTPPAPRTVIAFEVKLLVQLGLNASQQSASLSEPVANVIGALEKAGWDQVPLLKVSSSQARQLKQFLNGFLIYHLGKFPESRSQALFSRE